MKRALSAISRAVDWFDAPDDPREPAYDPIHLGGVLVLLMVCVGALYWLLWTLLVYEGGIFPKISAAASVLFTRKTPADFGYTGQPYAMGIFEGWLGNVGALLFGLGALAGLHRLYAKAARRHR